MISKNTEASKMYNALTYMYVRKTCVIVPPIGRKGSKSHTKLSIRDTQHSRHTRRAKFARADVRKVNCNCSRHFVFILHYITQNNPKMEIYAHRFTQNVYSLHKIRNTHDVQTLLPEQTSKKACLCSKDTEKIAEALNMIHGML